jgi:ABC-type glutathione transport system ATPase component
VADVIVELDHVGVEYHAGPAWARRRVLAADDVSLAIDSRETLGLVGESGSGKSTLARVSLGLLRPTRGSVRFEGRPMAPPRELRGRLEVVLQNPEWSLDPRVRVGMSVAEPLAILGTGSAAERRGKASEMLEQVGLDVSLADRFPHQLSGGQRQRIAIARALITSPAFIVFDEVVSALDVSIQAQILALIRRLQAERHFAALFISHDLAVVRYLSHRVAVMQAGRIVEIAPSSAFYGRPSHPYSRQLVAAIA